MAYFKIGDRVQTPSLEGGLRSGVVDEFFSDGQLIWVKWDEPIVETITSTRAGFFPGQLELVEAVPRTLVQQFWIESERGWGMRPDGYTLHLDESGREQFVRDFEKSQNTTLHPPDSYSFPARVQNVEVSAALYSQISAEIIGQGKTHWRTKSLSELEQEATDAGQ